MPNLILEVSGGTGGSGDDFTADEIAAITGAASPSGSNVFATIDDIPTDLDDYTLSPDILAAISRAAAPSAENVFATIADIPDDTDTPDDHLVLVNSSDTTPGYLANSLQSADSSVEISAITGEDGKIRVDLSVSDTDTPELSVDQLAAVTGAAAPSAENVFATIADIPGPVDGPDIRILDATLIGVTETTIAHGLSGTPMSVFVLPVGPQFVWESSPADATNIYLTASAPCSPIIAIKE